MLKPTLLRALFAVTTCFVAAAQQPVYHTAQQPQTDWSVTAVPGGVILSMPGIADDFVLSGGGQFVELPDGTARFTGRVLSNSRIYAAFLVDLQLGGRINAGATPPAGAPVTTLLGNAYVPNGPVDPTQFHYFTTGSGTLTGVREFDGAKVALSLASGAVQVGIGANNRNTSLGLAGTFQVQVLQQPFFPFGATSTAAFAADLVDDRRFDATHVQVNPTFSALANDRALELPGVAADYVFVPAAGFTEYSDGHATLTGKLARMNALDDGWQVAFTFGSRIDPGQIGCPPVGSPVLGLLPSAYVANGGAIDPNAFHYYRTGSGTLTGLGINAGGALTLTPTTALQIGGGANQANQYFGLFGRFAVAINAQPIGRAIAVTGEANLHALTATFPVLPFPSLTTGTTPTLPTLTSQGVVLTGDNLAWVDSLFFGSDFISSTNARDWYTGWYRVLDNQHIEIHPVPGKPAGSYSVAVFNPAIISNRASVDLVQPTAPTLCSEATLAVGRTQHVLAHRGNATGNVLTAFAVSPSLSPSVMPGTLSLGIGNQFADLFIAPGLYAADPVTGIAQLNLGPIPPAIAGASMHFQSVVLELDAITFPLPVTGTWSTAYVQ